VRLWLRQDAALVLDRWAKHLPARQLHVVTLPRRGVDSAELWRRFASVPGADVAGWPEDDVPGNPSFDATQAETLRRVNVALGERLPVHQPYVQAVRFGVVPALLEAGEVRGVVDLDPRREAWLRERSAEQVRALRALDVDLTGSWDDLIPEPREGLTRRRRKPRSRRPPSERSLLSPSGTAGVSTKYAR
jgi:hypothetical protein